jgi:hypothetical protein
VSFVPHASTFVLANTTNSTIQILLFQPHTALSHPVGRKLAALNPAPDGRFADVQQARGLCNREILTHFCSVYSRRVLSYVCLQ